jgi:hypothetical protein
MVMLRKIHLILSLCLPWWGCSRLDNSHEDIKLRCGAEVDASAFRLIKLTDWQKDEITAILESSGQFALADKSSQGCIKIPRTIHESSQLIVRSNQRSRGFVLPLSEQQPALVMLAARDEFSESLKNQRSSFVCSRDLTKVNRELQVTRIDQASELLTFSALQFQVKDASGKVVQDGNLTLDTRSIVLDASLPEGSYQVQLISKDVFEPNTAPLQSSCSFIMDKTAPLASSSLGNKVTLADAIGSRKVLPAEQIVLNKGADSEATVYACKKKRMSEALVQPCDDPDDFRQMDAITADMDGVWDLYYYAVDQAGNRSALVHETYSVYNQPAIEKGLDQISIAQLNDALGKQKQSLESMERAARIISDLSLQAERDTIRWPFLEGFWNLDQKLSFLGSIEEESTVRQLQASVRGRRFLSVLDSGEANIYEGRTKLTSLSGVKRAAFADDSKLWVYSNQQELSYIEAGQTVFSQKVELGEAQLAVAPSGLAAVLWDDRTALLVNRGGAEPLGRIELPQGSFYRNRFEFSRRGDYLVGRNGSTISVYSLSNIVQPLTYSEPTGCVIREFALRGVDEIYLISRWNRRVGIPPDDATNPCGLKKLTVRDGNLESNSLKELYPKNFTQLAHLAISHDPEEAMLLLGDEASSVYYSFDLRQDGQSALVQALTRDDSLASLEAVAGDKPSFLIRSKNLLKFVTEISGNLTSLFQESKESGFCIPQSQSRTISCFDSPKGKDIRIYSFSRSKALQPNIFLEADRLSGDFVLASQLLDVSRDLRYVLIGQETRNRVMLQEISGDFITEHLLPERPTFVSVSAEGQSAVALADGRIGSFGPEQPIAWFEALDGRSLVQLKQSGARTLAILRSSNSLELLSLKREQNRLVPEQTLSFADPEAYDQLVVNDLNEFAVLYKLSRGVIRQQRLPVIRLADFAVIKELDAQASKIEWQEDTGIIRYAQSRSIRSFDAVTGEDTEVAGKLNFQPGFIPGTKRLLAVDEKETLWDVELNKTLGVLFLDIAEGAGDTLLLGPYEGNLMVLDAKTSDSRAAVKLNGQAKVLRFFTRPGSSDFAFSYYEPFVGYGVKIMTTDLAKARDWLRSW